MFSTPESAQISDEFVAVHILGGDDLDEDGRAFLQRYGVQGYPTLLAVTAAGGLVNGDLLDGQLRDATSLVEAMRGAKEVNEAFLAERDALAAKTDPESMEELAGLFAERRQAKKARALYEKILATSGDAASVETYDRLLGILRLQEDKDAEKVVLVELIERFPDHEERVNWRVRHRTIDLPPPTSRADMEAFLSRYAAALEELRKETADAGDAAGEAGVRVHLAAVAADGGDEEGFDRHIAWILENAADTPAAREARLLLVRRSLASRKTDAAKEHATWIVENAPESRQAAEAHMVLGDLAYGDGDNDAMQAHFEAVVRLAPTSRTAQIAQGVLDMLAQQAAPEDDAPGMGD